MSRKMHRTEWKWDSLLVKWKSADGTVGYWTHNGKIEANVEVFRSPETLKSCFFVNGGGKKKDFEMAGYREPCPMDALKESHRMIMHASEKKVENFYSFIPKSLFALLSCIIWKDFLLVLLHLLNNHPVISTRNQACQTQINQLLSS